MGRAGSAEEFETDGASNAPRLTREMSSRKLQALDFIKRYFARWGCSPTLGELAAHMGISIKRAHEVVHQLAEQQMIGHEAGKTRGIRLIDRGQELSEADVLVRLSGLGWTIAQGNLLYPPGSAGAAGPIELDHDPLVAAVVGALTENGLPLPVDLDHEDGEGAGIHGENEEGRAA